MLGVPVRTSLHCIQEGTNFQLQDLDGLNLGGRVQLGRVEGYSQWREWCGTEIPRACRGNCSWRHLAFEWRIKSGTGEGVG